MTTTIEWQVTGIGDNVCRVFYRAEDVRRFIRGELATFAGSFDAARTQVLTVQVLRVERNLVPPASAESPPVRWVVAKRKPTKRGRK